MAFPFVNETIFASNKNVRERFMLKARQFSRVVISYRNNDGKSFEVGLGSRTTISFIPFVSPPVSMSMFLCMLLISHFALFS